TGPPVSRRGEDARGLLGGAGSRDRPEPLRAGPPVSRQVRDKPLPLLAPAAPRCRPRPDRSAPTTGRGCLGGPLCRSGPFDADVPGRLGAHARALGRAESADRPRSGALAGPAGGKVILVEYRRGLGHWGTSYQPTEGLGVLQSAQKTDLRWLRRPRVA